LRSGVEADHHGDRGRIRAVRATRINHVSVSARDFAESVRFYSEVLGMEPVATPDFGFPV
jgi:catechol-2,3-dioxygenase